MKLKLKHLWGVVGIIVMAGVGPPGGSALAASEPDQDNLRPPQTLPKGFESTDRLLRDLDQMDPHRETAGASC